MGYLLFTAFLAVPLAEIALFVVVGERIGVLATVAIVVATAVAGAALVRHQGIQTFERARREIDANRVPAGALAEGLAILTAGALLLTPGFLTDAVGFALLVPAVRRMVIGFVGKRLATRVTVIDPRGGRPGPREDGPVIEGEVVEVDEPPKRRDGSPWRSR